MVTGAGAGLISVKCAVHTFELTLAASPAVALPAMGTTVSLAFHAEIDDLGDALGGWGITLRAEGGALLLAAGGGHDVVIPGLEDDLGAEDLCPKQEIDPVLCQAYRRTTVTVTAEGSILTAFDHASVEAGGLRMVIGEALWRTTSPDFDTNPECSAGGLGPGYGRFAVVIGPPG